MSASCPALQQVAYLDTKFSGQRLVDAPHYRLTYLRWRQQLLAARAFTPVATALQPAAPAAKFCAQCGRARGEETWACSPLMRAQILKAPAGPC